jgi:hypothetical protein
MPDPSSSVGVQIAGEPQLSSADQLTLAIRRIVHEELGKQTEKPEAAGSSLRESLAVLLLIVNIILLYTCLPKDVVNKDLMDFIAKVATFVGGGLALLNPEAFRRVLTQYISRPAFLPVNLVLLVLLAGGRLGRVPMRVETDPSSAVVIVDNSETHASGERLWLSIADHKLKLHPGEGDIIVGETRTKIEDREVPIGWTGVLEHIWPWAPTPHLGMLSKVFVTFDQVGHYRLIIHSQKHPFDAEFRRSTTELRFRGPYEANRETPGELDQDSFTIPFGVYGVAVVADGPGKQTCGTLTFTVDARANALAPGELRCAK